MQDSFAIGLFCRDMLWIIKVSSEAFDYLPIWYLPNIYRSDTSRHDSPLPILDWLLRFFTRRPCNKMRGGGGMRLKRWMRHLRGCWLGLVLPLPLLFVTLQFVSMHIPVYLYIYMNTYRVSHARIADIYVCMSVCDASVREYAHTCVSIYVYEYISCLTRSYCWYIYIYVCSWRLCSWVCTYLCIYIYLWIHIVSYMLVLLMCTYLCLFVTLVFVSMHMHVYLHICMNTFGVWHARIARRRETYICIYVYIYLFVTRQFASPIQHSILTRGMWGGGGGEVKRGADTATRPLCSLVSAVSVYCVNPMIILPLDRFFRSTMSEILCGLLSQW